MLLCKKIKLEVSEEDAAALEFMQAKCRGLYNWWIGRLRDGEKWPGWKDAKASLQDSKQHDPELCQVYGKLLLEVYFRADKPSHLIAHTLVARTVVVGDLSQRQMVTKEHIARNKYLNRSVFNEWGC